MKLLIVDDSAMVRRSIQRLVDGGAFSAIYEARDGREGLDLFAEHRPDAVTMDITMPEMDGIAAVGAMMKLNAEARILVISALSHKGPAIEAVKRGALGFLLKPVTAERLNEALTSILE